MRKGPLARRISLIGLMLLGLGCRIWLRPRLPTTGRGGQRGLPPRWIISLYVPDGNLARLRVATAWWPVFREMRPSRGSPLWHHLQLTWR